MEENVAKLAFLLWDPGFEVLQYFLFIHPGLNWVSEHFISS